MVQGGRGGRCGSVCVRFGPSAVFLVHPNDRHQSSGGRSANHKSRTYKSLKHAVSVPSTSLPPKSPVVKVSVRANVVTFHLRMPLPPCRSWFAEIARRLWVPGSDNSPGGADDGVQWNRKCKGVSCKSTTCNVAPQIGGKARYAD